MLWLSGDGRRWRINVAVTRKGERIKVKARDLRFIWVDPKIVARRTSLR